MIYLDTSAAAKLVLHEAHSDALGAFLIARVQTQLVSSVLLYPELVRVVTRHKPEKVTRVIDLFARIATVPLDNEIVVAAATVGTPALRTLDALHLATASFLATKLEAFVTYDKRLAEAVAGIGITATAPGEG